jgi:hypothetical protein
MLCHLEGSAIIIIINLLLIILNLALLSLWFIIKVVMLKRRDCETQD